MRRKRLISKVLFIMMLGISTMPASMVYAQDAISVPNPIQVIDLDKDLPVGEEYVVDEELVFANPFGDTALAADLQEYEEYEIPQLIQYRSGWQPLWEKGLTISYWMKAPVDENGNYMPTSVLRWELNQDMYQVGDYSKHLTAKYFDVLQEKMTESEKVLALKEESGVLYGSPYYFKYAETIGTDENGAPVAKEYTEDGLTGPVYDYRFIYGTEGYEVSEYYYYNPAFKRGFVKLADGTYEPQLEYVAPNNGNNYYDVYRELDVASGSVVRRADVYGELQIDIDNSFHWIPEVSAGVNKNPNTATSGEAIKMQPKNGCYMNSWRYNRSYSQGVNTTDTSYQGAISAALSPITAIDEDGNVVKNGNCNIWHQVTVTLQNDWMEFYVDGVCVDVYKNYDVQDFGQFRYFNKGTGMRYGIGTGGIEPVMGNLSSEGFVGQLLMEWITNENATLHIGGKGEAGVECNQAVSASAFSLDDICFYGQLLSEQQIKAAYEEQVTLRDNQTGDKEQPSENVSVPGDLDDSGKVSLEDAQMVLKAALKIQQLSDVQIPVADVDKDEVVTLKDAQGVLKIALRIMHLT